MMKALLCIGTGVVLGMLLYFLGMPDPFPPVICASVSGTMAFLMED